MFHVSENLKYDFKLYKIKTLSRLNKTVMGSRILRRNINATRLTWFQVSYSKYLY